MPSICMHRKQNNVQHNYHNVKDPSQMFKNYFYFKPGQCEKLPEFESAHTEAVTLTRNSRGSFQARQQSL